MKNKFVLKELNSSMDLLGGGGGGGYRKGAQPLVLAKGVQEGVHFRMKSKFWIWYFAGNYETIFWG
jgi:hypothetical protein